jgi:hypothetical protein
MWCRCHIINNTIDAQIYSELAARSMASGDTKLQEKRYYFSVRTTACASKMNKFVIA